MASLRSSFDQLIRQLGLGGSGGGGGSPAPPVRGGVDHGTNGGTNIGNAGGGGASSGGGSSSGGGGGAAVPSLSLTGLASGVTYLENTVNAAPQTLDSDMTFTAGNVSSFDGYVFSVRYSSSAVTEAVSIENQGMGAGQIGVAGSAVYYGGVEIGTIHNVYDGTSGKTLKVTFNSNAVSAAIEALLEHVQYQNTSNTPVSSRQLTLDVSTSDGSRSGSASVTVTITPQADSFAFTAGTDSLEGAAGNDTVTGDADDVGVSDTVVGGGGTDVISLTGAGTGTLGSGVSGIEQVTLADVGNFSLTLSSPNLTTLVVDGSALTGANTVSLDGSTFTGTLSAAGGASNDTLKGGSGGDTFSGGAGNDSIVGNGGDDTISTTDANITTNDTFTGGTGTDTLLLTDAASIASVDITNVTGIDVIDLQGTGNTLVLSDAFVDASDSDSVELVFGANTITSLDTSAVNSARNVVLNGTGAVTLANNASRVTLKDGTNVSITGGTLNDTIIGGTGNDTINGGTGDNIITAGAGTDTITYQSTDITSVDGGAGSDTLQSVTGTLNAALLDGTKYNNIETFSSFVNATASLTFGAGYTIDTNTTTTLTVNGSAVLTANTLTVDVSAITQSINASITGGTGNDTLTGGTGNDTISAGNGNNAVVGNAGNDSLTTGTGTDTLTGGAGADTLTGGTGIDLFTYTAISDSSYANPDRITDFLGSGAADQIVLTGLGFTDIQAGAASGNVLGYTNNGVDTYIVNAANTFQLILTGVYTSLTSGVNVVVDGGAFTLTAGSDNFVGAASTSDVFTTAEANFAAGDTLTGGTGYDVISWTNAAAIASAELTNKTGIDGIRFTAAGNTAVLSDAFVGAADNQTLTLENGAFTITSLNTSAVTTPANRVYIGGTGQVSLVTANNIVYAKDGVATLILAGAGNDTIIGGSGNDIFGQAGVGGANDRFDGGAGNDHFNSITGANIVAANTLAGGVGVDQFSSLSTNFLTLSSTNMTNISGFEIFGVGNGGASSIVIPASYTIDTGTTLTISNGGVAATLTADVSAMTQLGVNASITGGTLADTITGGLGNDTITAGAGSNSVSGGAGDDTFVYNNTTTTIAGGSGVDTMTTVNGTIGAGVLDGTILNGIESFTTSNATTNLAFAATYTIDTGSTLTINGAAITTGGSTLTVDSSLLSVNASVTGGVDADTISTGSGHDTISGGTGNNSISAGGGDDSITASTGNDTITGGTGSDTITASTGNDTFIYTAVNHSAYNNADRITDFTAGTDVINLSALSFTDLVAGAGSGTTLGYTNDGTDTTIEDAAGTFRLILTGVFTDLQAGRDVLFNGGAFTLTGASDNFVGAASTADIFTTAEANFAAADTLTGNTGTDTIVFTDAATITSAELANKTGIDTLRFSASGNSVILNDSFVGSGDNDSIILANSSYTITNLDTSAVTTSANKVYVGGTGAVTLANNAGNRVYGRDGIATSIISGTGDDTIIGGTGNDTITYTISDITSVQGGTGTGIDALTGVTGTLDDSLLNGTIYGGFENFTTGNANTRLTFASTYTADSSITVTGAAMVGASTLFVDASALSTALSITGGAASDTITGGSGADTINGGTGANSITAGAGNDTVAFRNSSETLAGGSGTDTLQSVSGTLSFTNITGFETFTTTNATTNLTFGSGYTLDTGTTLTVNAAAITTTTNTLTANLSAIASGIAASITGGAGADTITGGSGNDTINAGAGNDSITGGDGNDSIVGGTGSDIITGGLGADTLTGSTGNDNYVYNSVSESAFATPDRITDFMVGNGQTINLSALGFTDIQAGTASGTVLGYTNDGTDTTIVDAAQTFKLVLTGVYTSLLAQREIVLATNNVTLTGAADNVIGTAGVDYIETANANFSAADTIVGSSGTDKLLFTDSGTITSASLANKSSIEILQLQGGSSNTITLNDTFVGSAANQSVLIQSSIATVDTSAVTTPANKVYFNTGTITLANNAGNRVYATDGGVAKTFRGGTGADSIYGGSGVDSISGGGGDNVIDAGAAADTVIFSPTDATSVTGGLGSDTLTSVYGTLNATQLNGTAGAGVYDNFETITTLNATTSLTFGVSYAIDTTSTTTLTITGSAITTAGRTLTVDMSASSINTSIIGGSGGNDTLIGGSGNDTIDGNVGDDYMDGGAGNDLITFRVGDRTYVQGGTGVDTLNGTSGTLDGTVLNNSTLYGGFEKFFVSSSAASRLIFGSGYTLDTGTTLTIAGNGATYADTSAIVQAINTSMTGGNSNNDTLISGGGDDTLSGGNGNDSIVGGNGANSITGGAGNDTITAGTGNDIITDVSGNNSISGGNGDNTIIGGTGNDTITSGTGNDSILAGDNADSITSGAANDMIIAGEGSDTVDAGDGDDVIAARYLTATRPNATTPSGTNVKLWLDASDIDGDGNSANNPTSGASVLTWVDKSGSGNSVVVPGVTNAPTYQSGALNGQAVVQFDGIDDYFYNTAASVDLGNQYEVFIVANNTKTTASSGLMQLSLSAGSGAPGLFAALTNNNIVRFGHRSPYASSGGDESNTGTVTANYTLYTLERDVVQSIYLNGELRSLTTMGASAFTPSPDLLQIGNFATLGVAPLQGNIAEVILVNTALSQTDRQGIEQYLIEKYNIAFTEEAASDSLQGGNGDDTIYMGSGFDANDTIDGGANTDTMNLSGDYSSGVTIGANVSNVETVELGEGYDYVLTVTNPGMASFTIDGSDLGSSDTLNVNASAFAGDISMVGGAAADTLVGGTGDDSLQGGEGKDSMTGGTGADSFVFTTSSDSTQTYATMDVITDFSHADGDLIDLSAFAGTFIFQSAGTGLNEFVSSVPQVAYTLQAGGTDIFVDSNGDNRTDFMIHLNTAVALVSGDFVL